LVGGADMSRIGKKPVEIPEGVEVNVDENKVSVKGPKGQLEQIFDQGMDISLDDNQIIVQRPDDQVKNRSLHGLVRSLINNMVEGVTKGYSKSLELRGVGYRASMKGSTLVIAVGYSHPVEITPPEGINVEVPSNTEINISGIDKQKVGQFAAHIRSIREPEPYKGKGIRYKGEYVRQKVGKTG